MTDHQNKQLVYTTFLQREESTYHHTYDEELLQYEYLRDGDMRSVEESKRLFRHNINGTLSDDPLRHTKYLFVASTTLATRFAIEGGLMSQTAYNLSDLYIQRMDRCNSIKEVYALQTEMIRDFTQRIIDLRTMSIQGETDGSVNRPLEKAMDYIYYHLHEKIAAADVAEAAGLSPNYLNTVFRKEKGVTLHQYIMNRRIEAAENMILYSDYTETEIAEFLAFSSTSHFIKCFRSALGMTPRQYLQKNYRRHKKWQK